MKLEDGINPFEKKGTLNCKPREKKKEAPGKIGSTEYGKLENIREKLWKGVIPTAPPAKG